MPFYLNCLSRRMLLIRGNVRKEVCRHMALSPNVAKLMLPKSSMPWGYPTYMSSLRKLGTIGITEHGSKTKAEISCQKMDEKMKKKYFFNAGTRFGWRSTSYPVILRKCGWENLSNTRLLGRLILLLQGKCPNGGYFFLTRSSGVTLRS